MSRYFVVCAALMLAGCLHQPGDPGPIAGTVYCAPADYGCKERNKDIACRTNGAKPRSAAYASCRASIERDLAAARTAPAAQSDGVDQAAQYLTNVGQPPMVTPAPAPIPQQPIQCQTWRNGSVTCQGINPL